MSRPSASMIGQKFGRLTVINQAGVNKHRTRIWNCLCDCGGHVVVSTSSLRSGNTQSCGCLHKDSVRTAGQNGRNRNMYDLTQDHGVGHTKDGRIFLFDKEDYALIADYTWSFNDQGYVISQPFGKPIRMHRLVMHAAADMDVHHINHNPADNRKRNLECVSHAKNIQLSKKATNNTSGHRGVAWDASRKKWLASIACEGKSHYLGRFLRIEDAIEARRQGELKYYGAPLPDSSL